MELSRAQCEHFIRNPTVHPITGELLRLGDDRLTAIEVKCEKYRLAPNLILDRYILQEQLGHGTFGVTYKAVDIHTDRHVAIKAIDKLKYAIHPTIDDEIDTLRQFTRMHRCRYIVSYYGSIDTFWDHIPTTFIITEYIDGATLKKIIEDNPGYIDRSLLMPLIHQLLLGLKVIHKAGYAHRDIKPENLVLNREGHLVYIDFGLACVEECRYAHCTNLCTGNPGTLLYNPPEYYQPEFISSYEQAKAHDIWSLGIVLFQLANTGQYPFDVTTDKAVLRQNIADAPKMGSNYPHDFMDHAINDFIDSLLINDYTDRPSIKDALSEYIDCVSTNIEITYI